MSELLEQLLAGHAFDAQPQGPELAMFHVPFDDIFGGAEVESELGRAAAALERVAVIGPAGSGKTSVTSYVLQRLSEAPLAPIFVSVGIEPSDAIEDPKLFLQHIVAVISGHAQRANQLTDSEREAILAASTTTRALEDRAVTTGGKGGLDLWVVNGDMARDVTRTVSGGAMQRPGVELEEQLVQVLEVVRSYELSPILIFDDSDAFTRTAGGKDRTPLVAGFFGPALRSIAGLGLGIIVMVHESYIELESFQELELQTIEARITLPRFEDGLQLGRLFERRIGEVVEGATPADVFAAEALVELYGLYLGSKVKRSVRSTVTVAQRALNESVQAGHEIIGSDAITGAASAQGLNAD